MPVLKSLLSNFELQHWCLFAHRTNFPKEVTQYLDFEFTQGKSSYVNRQDIHNYLRDYVEHFKLRPYIQVNKITVKTDSVTAKVLNFRTLFLAVS